uniref:ZP domain-containing protein n=1 Tax=Esox lucius TaxID=8010 RepID=A0A3P8ZJD5_ESOLU
IPNYNNDLKVVCGANVISLEVNLCSAQWAGFDPTTLALNGQRNTSQCLGLADTQVDPPVIRYQLPVNESQGNPCLPDASGPFGSFSSVQAVVVTGYIDTPKSSSGIISYSTDLYYHFSCRYPLEYLLNNTKIVASSVSVATSDNNGTFINTLTMSVYNVSVDMQSQQFNVTCHVCNKNCTRQKTKHVAINLQHRCVVDAHTSVTVNGISKNSRFSFEAFRFVIHKNMDRSTIYLHCIIRLCEPSKRKRSMEALASEAGDSATVSVGPLYTGRSGKT